MLLTLKSSFAAWMRVTAGLAAVKPFASVFLREVVSITVSSFSVLFVRMEEEPVTTFQPLHLQ